MNDFLIRQNEILIRNHEQWLEPELDEEESEDNFDWIMDCYAKDILRGLEA